MFSSAYIWAKVLGYLEEHLDPIIVSNSLDDAELVEITTEHLILYSPSEFRREVLRRRYAQYIHDALKELFDYDAQLIVFGDEELNNYKNKNTE